MKHGADYSKLKFEGQSPFHLAVRDDHLDATSALLATGVDVNIGNGVDGSWPLLLTASDGHTAVLRALIQNGTDINRVNSHGATALQEAACGDEAGAFDMLVEACANMNAVEDARMRRYPCTSLSVDVASRPSLLW